MMAAIAWPNVAGPHPNGERAHIWDAPVICSRDMRAVCVHVITPDSNEASSQTNWRLGVVAKAAKASAQLDNVWRFI